MQVSVNVKWSLRSPQDRHNLNTKKTIRDELLHLSGILYSV